MIVEVSEFAKKSAGNSLSSRFVSDDRFCAFFHNIDFNIEILYNVKESTNLSQT
jgi:hypothetical protein